MKQRFRRACVNDEGALLILVLLLVLVVALVCGAVVSTVQAAVGNALIVHGQQDKVYAVDSALEYGLAKLRADSTLCIDSDSSHDWTTTATFEGRAVDLHCHVVTGSVNGLNGYSIVTTGNGLGSASSLTTQSGSTPRVVRGPVWAKTIDSDARIEVRNGNVDTSTCTQPGNFSVKPSPPFAYRCPAAVAQPDPAPTVPSSLPASAPSPLLVTADCTAFYPGRYSGSLPLTSSNYFVSGLYYFNNVSISLTGQTIVGGAPANSADPTVTSANACTSDHAAVLRGLAECALTPLATCQYPAIDPVGTGVKWIFGGSSRLSLASSGTGGGSIVELFSRKGGPTSEGTQRVSLMAAPSGTALNASNLTFASGTPIINVASGNNTDVSFHGMVYAPNAIANLFATEDVFAQIRNGIMVAQLNLQASSSSHNFGISTETGDEPRRLILTAITHDAAEKQITARLIATIQNDESHSLSIESWRSSD